MNTRALAKASLQADAPNTFNSFTWLVPAMEDAQKNAGKKSLFGKDKGAIAYEKFLAHLQTTLLSMHKDRLIDSATEPERVRTQLVSALQLFAHGHPNWPDAYRFGDEFFGRGMHPRLADAINEAWQTVNFLDRPSITRRSRT